VKKWKPLTGKDKIMNGDVRWGVAGNPNTPIKLLEELAKDEDRDVRGGVAGNPNTPIKLLEELAKDYYEEEEDSEDE
jgi:pentose-5-phosphate-3-epimerase